MRAEHFDPWGKPRPCWHCTAFDGLTAGGSAALCARPMCCRVRSSPADGCAQWEREVGADDEPDARPALAEPPALVPRGPIQPLPRASTVEWAP